MDGPTRNRSTRVGAAIGYALAYFIIGLGIYGAGAVVAALLAALGIIRLDPFGGMVIAAALLALGYRQASQGGRAQ